ncbi:MAG TPA: TetR/AcrR family transcriptional regulator [Ktedonobacterales bacterium]|nr:TetR/AcrR family transcriptional regulator [Ktedonobacterales bacterium]
MPRPANPARRAAILAVARTLFHERDYASTTMADIAAAAGMGVGSLYVYFSTKEAIALTLVERYFAELREGIVPPLRDLAGGEAISQALAAGIKSAERNIDVVALLRVIPPGHVLPERQQLLEAIERAVERQVRQGYFRPLDPTFITEWINAQVEWVIIRSLIERAGEIEDYRRQVTELIVRAIVQPPSASDA